MVLKFIERMTSGQPLYNNQNQYDFDYFASKRLLTTSQFTIFQKLST